ncbi:hypothetical protein HDU98_001899 [Podochytrium sp. JEL0797]|nr:hypothetical protein HDU98_001899 [Podochytrium sp. JEL0797]
MTNPSPPQPSLADLYDLINQVATNESLFQPQSDTITVNQQTTSTRIETRFETLQSSLSATQSCINSLQTSSLSSLRLPTTTDNSLSKSPTLQNPTKKHYTRITNLPSETALQILSWILPKDAWKLRRLSKAFKAIISSNLARFVPRPDLSFKESKRPTTSDLAFPVAPQTYRDAHIRFSDQLHSIAIGTHLKSLQEIDLSYNNLVGRIPISVSSIKSLYYYWISSDNQLSGVIPPELGLLKNLLLLVLNSNQFTGPLPSEIGNLAA